MARRVVESVWPEQFAGLGDPSPDTVIQAVDGVRVLVDGRELTSFISASYLGLEHDPVSSTGFGFSVPRALAAHGDTVQLERELAALVSCEEALVAPSTLHALCDTVGVLGARGSVVLDPGAYSLTQVAAERARGLGIKTVQVPLRDGRRLESSLAKLPHPCLVLCESVALPGILAPLPSWVERCQQHGATLVVDDTQGFGLLGATPDEFNPYGTNGSGALDFLGRPARGDVVLISSLTKAFGVPLTFSAGRSATIQKLRRDGVTAWSSSQPDLVSVRFALRALDWNRHEGDATRRRLANAVREFRATAHTRGFGVFPIQSWYFRSLERARATHARLMEKGIWSLLHPSPAERTGSAAIRFFLTAQHSGPDLARALASINQVQKEAR